MLNVLTVTLQNHIYKKSHVEQRRYKSRHLIPMFIETPSTSINLQDIDSWTDKNNNRSATNMVWIEEKMKLLGCTTNPNYKVIHFQNKHLSEIINVQV